MGSCEWRTALADAVDACIAADATQIDDATLLADLVAVSHAVRRLEGRQARLVAEQLRRRPARLAGDATRAVKESLGVSGAEARRIASTAEALLALPEPAGDALAEGTMSSEQLRTLHAAGELPQETCAALVTMAPTVDPDVFRKRVQAAAMQADADDGAARAARQRAARTAYWRELDDGMHELRARLAPDDGAVVRGALQQLMDRRWRAERREFGERRVRRDPPGARLADALVELARGASGEQGRPGSTRSVVTVLVDLETLQRGLHERSVHEDGWGTRLTPSTIRRLACDAEILPVVLGGAGVPVDVGRKRRLPTPSQRAALAARDRHCRFPGCTLPEAWCQVHHIVEWPDGGTTDLSNLILLCHQDHDRVHSGRWRVLGTADALRFVSPAGVVYESGLGDGGPGDEEPQPP